MGRPRDRRRIQDTNGRDRSRGSKEGIVFRVSPVAKHLIEVAVSAVESGGDYNIRSLKPDRRGNYAYGRYQVMDYNIPKWSKAYCGRALTIEEWRKDPECQDLVAGRIFTENLRVYGTKEDALSLWFSGLPFHGNSRCDTLGTCVPQYVAKAINSLKK